MSVASDSAVVIGLSAVVVAIQEDDAVVLTVRPRGASAEGLPFGPFDPLGHRTFELAMRAFVTAQTRFTLGYVEQLYTFGDKGRDAPLADMGSLGGGLDGDPAGQARVISVGYLALATAAVDTHAPGSEWRPWSRFFPYEDWREGRPAALPLIEDALRRWAEGDAQRLGRARLLFALDGAPWNEERVLERYELLYEAGLAREAARDRSEAATALPAPLAAALGEPMLSDHRRILATAVSRLRGKLKYRPVVFELMPEAFTLSALQRAVEAIAGVPLHKQNFRRALERADLVEGLGRMDADTGGRPAELYRFRREILGARPVSGLSLPLLRE
ncbi:MAG: NAD regulator [Caulobacterales bacterium]